MLDFALVMRQLRELAKPDCPVCKGAGRYNGEDRAIVQCDCTGPQLPPAAEEAKP